MSPSKPKLYTYFRSSCSWRVRIALAYKCIEYDSIPVHLLKKEQLSTEYLELNPMGQVPTLCIDGNVLVQSIAIMEYLEEVYSDKPLLPVDPIQKAKVREICELIGSGIQPIQNNAVLFKYSADDEAKRFEWANYWISRGLEALEKVLTKSAGKYCVGDNMTMADCCLVPQVFNAVRFKVDLTPFPTISRINDTLSLLEHFKVAHPSSQEDCPPELK